ncbi:hypothetical protein [Planctomonas deserti]|uniref:hypothetical protein n=1 Tax=Planctomonas deserti TaxID=2144185 RepID=UPI000D382D11|nr:hypothetical protein [Planctomonas deserti]
MTEGQIGALIFSPICIIWGICFIIFRARISAATQRQRNERGHYRSAATQTPGLMAAAGTFCIIAGIVLPILVFSGAL